MNEPDNGVSATACAVLRAAMPCWKCGELPAVAAIWIDADLSGQAYGDGPALLTYIESLNPEAMEQVFALAPWMRLTPSFTTQRLYLANHCGPCGTLQGDHFVHGVDGPFFPQTDEEIARIRIAAGKGHLRAEADCSRSAWMSHINLNAGG